MIKTLLILSSFALSFNLFAVTMAKAPSNCTASKKKSVCDDALVKAKVEAGCKLVKEKGDAALIEIEKTLDYDCCGEPDYVWVHTLNKKGEKVKMLAHSKKKQLKNPKKDLSLTVDPKTGNNIFVDFNNAVTEVPTGKWVKYNWAKFGESEPTPKRSWVVKCKPAGLNEEWVVGSGTWE